MKSLFKWGIYSGLTWLEWTKTTNAIFTLKVCMQTQTPNQTTRPPGFNQQQNLTLSHPPLATVEASLYFLRGSMGQNKPKKKKHLLCQVNALSDFTVYRDILWPSQPPPPTPHPALRRWPLWIWNVWESRTISKSGTMSRPVLLDIF